MLCEKHVSFEINKNNKFLFFYPFFKKDKFFRKMSSQLSAKDWSSHTCLACNGTGSKFNIIFNRQESCYICFGSGRTPFSFAIYPQSVTVQEGDCFFTIAKRIYGKGDKWPLIYLHNRDKVIHPDHLIPKTSLSIPNVNFFRMRPYLVTVKKSNDTLFLIAKKVYWNAKKWSDIYDANRYQLSDRNPHAFLTAGIVLIIP